MSGPAADVVLRAYEVATMADGALKTIFSICILGMAVPSRRIILTNTIANVAPRGNVNLAIARASLELDVLRLEMTMSSRTVAHSCATFDVILHCNIVTTTMSNTSH
jgi:hypothetical protein